MNFAWNLVVGMGIRRWRADARDVFALVDAKADNTGLHEVQVQTCGEKWTLVTYVTSPETGRELAEAKMAELLEKGARK